MTEAPRATRRRVRHSEHFLATARSEFPPNGSVAGRPTFTMFKEGPMKAADELLAWNFDSLPEEQGVRTAVVIAPPFFYLPMVFYAVLRTKDGSGDVEITGFSLDEDYLEVIANDPLDD